MKKLITLLIIFNFSKGVIHSQPQEFSIILGDDMVYVVDMIQTSSGNLVVMGTDGLYQVFITEITPKGKQLWGKLYEGELLWYADIFEKSDGHLLIPLSRTASCLLEIDQVGDSVNSISILESRSSYFESVIALDDSVLLASQIIFNDDPFFYAPDSSNYIKLGLNLNILQTYPSVLTDIIDIKFYSTGVFYALGNNYYNSPAHAQLIELNSNCQELSSSYCTSMNPYLHGINFLINDTLLFPGYTMDGGGPMQSILSIFKRENQNWFCIEYPGSYLISITKDEINQTIFALGERNDSCLVYAMDYWGNFINEISLGDTLVGNNILFEDDNLYIAGTSNYSNNPRACLIKISTDLLFSTEDISDKKLTQIFPNPAENEVNIILPENLNINSDYFVYGLLGDVVSSGQITSTDLITIDTRYFKPGFYIIVIRSMEGIYSGRFVKR